MAELDSIRLNVTIHREKDPALFALANGIKNKDARVRRLLTLATLGLHFENTCNNTSSRNNIVEPAPIARSENFIQEATSAKSAAAVIDEEESDALAEIFGGSKTTAP